MKKIYIFLSVVPFITACHSLSIQKSVKVLEKPQEIIDHSYFQFQADLYYIKGEQESNKGFYPQAVYLFKQALIYQPNSFYLHFRLIDEYLRASLYLQAFKQCNTLLKEQPNNIALHLKLAKIYEKNQLYNKAFDQYDWVLDKKPYHIETLYQKAMLHVQKGEFLQAHPIFKTLSQIEEGTNLYKIHYFLGQINKKTGQNQKAIFHFERSRHLQPDFILPAIELFFFYQTVNQKSKAIRVLEEFQKTAGFHPQVSISLFHFHVQKGNWDKAIEYLQPFVDADPGNWVIQAQLAWIWGQKKEYEKAITLIKKTISAHPRVSSQIYTLYAGLLEEQKAFSKALDVLLKASEIFPKDTKILFYTGVMYDQMGQTDQTIKWMKNVLSVDNNHVDALNHLAFVYAELSENLESAERLVVKALSLLPNDSYILDTAGWVLFKRGKVTEALKYLELAYQNNNSEGFIAEHLAEVYYYLNMVDKSIALYKKAIGLETNEDKKKKLQEKLLSIQLAV